MKISLLQTWLVMKITAFLIFFGTLQLSAASYAQDITLKVSNMRLFDILQIIEKQTGFVTFGSETIFGTTQPVTITFEKIPLEQALEQLFRNQPLIYRIEGKTIRVKEGQRTAAIGVRQQQQIVGRVTDERGEPLAGATVHAGGGEKRTTDRDGRFVLTNTAEEEELRISFIGYETVTIRIRLPLPVIVLAAQTSGLNEVVVTALGIKQEKRALGYAVTEVKGADIAGTQRENFVNALQGRVAGLNVSPSSGLPGASSSIVIRGISSLSGNNQPLFIVDGLPIDNTTFSTANLASDYTGSPTSFFNKGVDFSNRAADINPEDIESITVLKGPEASALYGIDAASGAIVITTKQGVSGQGKINYSNSFKFSSLLKYPEVQTTYGPGTNGVGDPDVLRYFGPEYPEGTQFYDNIKSFFRTPFTHRHNLSFEGGSNQVTYRLTGAYLNQEGVVPNTHLSRLNLGGSTSVTINRYLAAKVSLHYTSEDNNQIFKGSGGVLTGLLSWPATDHARIYLNPDGTRRLINETLTALNNETENPYFNINKNLNKSGMNRTNSNVELTFTPLRQVSSKAQFGIDNYTNNVLLVRHPQSNLGYSRGGVLDVATSENKNINAQLLNTFKQDFGPFKTQVMLGGSLNDFNYVTNAINAETLLDPDFYSINNTDLTKHRGRTMVRKRRLLGVFGNLTINYKNLLYLTGALRNDWSSTLPVSRQSFLSPSGQASFVFSELNAMKDLSWLSLGKLRFSAGSVGKDAPPYGVHPGLENQATTGGGYGYGFTAPSPSLRPERTRSMEAGTELKLFNNRLGVDVAVYRKKSIDQIIKDLRLSYGTGFILQVFNGGDIINEGLEIEISATPVRSANLTWDIFANFNATRSEVGVLPQGLPDFYSADITQYANLRNGVRPGFPTTTLTAPPYRRNNNGDILINPINGLPLLDATTWAIVGDRNPDFTIGLTNQLTFGSFRFSCLFDIRKGGDVFNATEHYMTERGLSTRTLDREQPVVIKGVLYDGFENTDHPSPNNIAVTPYYNSTDYYSTSGAISLEDFVEKNISWIRLRDITLNYRLSGNFLGAGKVLKSAHVFFTATDLFLLTNYSGLDPDISGSSAALGGSGSAGMDWGNIPTPIGFNCGIQIGL